VNENSEEFLSTVRVDVSNQTKMPTTTDQLNKDVKLRGSYVVVFHWRIHVYQFKILAVYLRVINWVESKLRVYNRVRLTQLLITKIC